MMDTMTLQRIRSAELLAGQARQELEAAGRRRKLPQISLTATIDRLHKGEPIDGELLRYNEDLDRAGVREMDPMRPMVPWSALSTRDTFVATASAGGYMVGTDVVTAYDTLRPYSVMLDNGAQVLEGLQGDTVLPQVSGTASGSWLATETATQAPSDATFTAKTLQPKTYAALTSISRHLRLAAAQAEPVVRRHLSRLLGSAIDAAILNGSGSSGQPEGLLTVTGTVSQSGTTLAQLGVTNMLQQVVDGGADDRRVIFVSTAAVRELLQNRERVSTSGQYVWQDNALAGKPAFATTSMPAATMVCGDPSNVVVGFFGEGVELMVDPFTAFKTGVVTVRAIVSVDVGILFPGSFCKSSSIT